MAETRIHPETGQVMRQDVRPQIVAFGSAEVGTHTTSDRTPVEAR